MFSAFFFNLSILKLYLCIFPTFVNSIAMACLAQLSNNPNIPNYEFITLHPELSLHSTFPTSFLQSQYICTNCCSIPLSPPLVVCQSEVLAQNFTRNITPSHIRLKLSPTKFPTYTRLPRSTKSSGATLQP